MTKQSTVPKQSLVCIVCDAPLNDSNSRLLHKLENEHYIGRNPRPHCKPCLLDYFFEMFQDAQGSAETASDSDSASDFDDSSYWYKAIEICVKHD